MIEILTVVILIVLLALVLKSLKSSAQRFNSNRDEIFRRLSDKYNLSLTIAGTNKIQPDPQIQSYNELRKLSGIFRGKKIVIQELVVDPGGTFPPPNEMIIQGTANNAQIRRLFVDGNEVSITPSISALKSVFLGNPKNNPPSEKQLSQFLDSL